MTTATAEQPREQQQKRSARPGNFTVEFGNTKNTKFWLLSVTRDKIEGSFSLSNTGGLPVSQNWRSMPDTPGQRVEVDFKNLTLRVHDPLADDPALMRAVNAAHAKAPIRTRTEYEPRPEKLITLSSHKFKTQVREIVQYAEQNHFDVTNGRLPTVDEIDAIDGRYLYDPLSESQAKPMFEEDVDDYHERIAARARQARI